MSEAKPGKRYNQETDLEKWVIGQKIARARNDKNGGSGRHGEYTQEDFCNELQDKFGVDIDVRKLSRIETGKQEPTLSLLVQMAMILDGKDWTWFITCLLEDALPPMLENYYLELDRRSLEKQGGGFSVKDLLAELDEYQAFLEYQRKQAYLQQKAIPADSGGSPVDLEEEGGNE